MMYYVALPPANFSIGHYASIYRQTGTTTVSTSTRVRPPSVGTHVCSTTVPSYVVAMDLVI